MVDQITLDMEEPSHDEFKGETEAQIEAVEALGELKPEVLEEAPAEVAPEQPVAAPSAFRVSESTRWGIH